jgi:endo-1,4-beta-xylanase
MKRRMYWLMSIVVIMFALTPHAFADTLLLTDFEDSSMEIGMYKGPESSITVSYVTDIVHEGQQAVLVKNDTKDWTGAVYNVPGNKADWSGISTFSMWAYGQNSGESFHVILEDAGLEQLWYSVTDNWEGWQQLNMPLEDFQSRTDWQSDQATVNQVIDYPLKSIHFCAAHGGTFNMYFDLFEVSGEGQSVASKPVSKQEITGSSLRELADQQNLVIGAAVEPDLLDNPVYAKTLSSQFNSLTPENRTKWQFIHPEKDRYDFSGADKLVEFAMNNNMKVKGHTLVWHSQNPEWLTTGTWTKEELLDILKDHIMQVAGRYKGKIHSWDVVNEALDGGLLRDTIWHQVIGPEYIEKAFIWAHEADPEAKLILNDYGVVELNAKSNAMYTLAQELLDKGIPIHGVAFQCHLVFEDPPDFASVYANVKRFVELGLDVEFPELDIRIRGEVTPEKLEKQAEIYKKLMEIALVFPKCSLFTMWGFTDAHSWVPNFFKGTGSALIFDEQYQPKPAYYALQEALQKGPVELNYEAMLDASQTDRHIIPPFQAMPATTVPTVDGVISSGEWDEGVLYKFAYNQLNLTDQRSPQDQQDLYGEWKILYDKNVIYGLVVREDDTTVTNHTNDWENDTIEVFFDIDGTFAQLRTIVGQNWAAHSLPGNRKTVWSEDGTVLEFIIELPEHDVTGMTIGWNIALADNDAGPGNPRDHQLYPIYGFNDSWEGKNLAEITFVGDTPRVSGKRHIAPPFKAMKASTIPTIDGILDTDEWKDGVVYQFAYNQLNLQDQRPPKDQNDLYGEWKILYDKNVIYGMLTCVDEMTVTDHTDAWENDNLAVFVDLADTFAQIRSIVGQDWAAHSLPGDRTIVWSKDGTVAEFMVELPADNLTGQIIGWNIALSDNDIGVDGTRDHQLYPIYGFNDSWEGKNLAEIEFQE